jgi:hypothetical protein
LRSIRYVAALASIVLAAACSSEHGLRKSSQRSHARTADAAGEDQAAPDDAVVAAQGKQEDPSKIFPIEGEDDVPGTAAAGGADGDDDLYEDRVDVVIGVGKLGRTLISCDGGHSWKNDTSQVPTGRCGVDPADCDHNPWSPSGLVIQNGYAFTTWGHDQGGEMLRAADGVTWESVQQGKPIRTLVLAGDTLFAGGLNATSVDIGSTWQRIADPGVRLGQSRGSTFVQELGSNGRVFSLGDSEGVYSDDFGVTWHRSTFNDGCTHGSMFYFPGSVVSRNWNGNVCASTDQGLTWAPTGLTGVRTALKVEDELWLITNDGQRRKTTDGLTWSEPEPLDPVWRTLSVVQYLPERKSFVGIQQGGYETQFAWVSDDGAAWTRLGPEQFQGGHPIISLVAGKVRPSETCPKFAAGP